ncbi:CCA tRNA nucleotidyltransferase [Actinokineospora globicatena]|uniref:CCA tRNA nucleotidyltransferase n=1 Tax=Actinokineospora globicatena TaxID=103729 RepID=A0A9W6QJD2_9PSEU|nr:CCA tRNA nucleotidyltransferase [Actinokineospora globicatena]GLW77090.1 CCA tRNA nucleotidyltransferase [Actinokineospora globicatena]GLW83924.1 CCA tRNA nucleotidyltransferase [Actinokineospora globicatena]GLW92131.1 CCA tRNA nucleotidyltransferase [Actinokineospora globicatena]
MSRTSATTNAARNAVVELLRVSPVADDLATRFAAAGHRLYLVGGSVRDAMLGRLGNDLDFTTDARPREIMRIVTGWADAVWDTGIAFGTVGAAKHGAQCEITTFRADAYDRVSRNPEVQFGDTIEADLVRRDFTVNAMAIDLSTRQFIDPHDGLDALANRVLDTPATPQESFADDPLRMLRAARFVSQLGFTCAPRVLEALHEMAGEITRITAERVQAELSKLLCGAHPRTGVELLVDSGLAAHVLPELPSMRLEIDEHHQHKDVYEHSLVVLDQAVALETEGPDLVLRLAALLHDIGKPDTRRHVPGGGVSFHHHEVVGAKLVRKRLRALRYSKEVIEDVARLVFLHLRFHGYGKGEWTDSAVRRYVTDADDLLPRLHKLVRADCTTRNRRKASALQRTYDGLEERIARIAADEDLARVRPDLDGNEIMRLLDVPPGPLVGKAWTFLKELRLDQGPLEYDDAVAALRSWARAQGLGVAAADQGEPADADEVAGTGAEDEQR